MSDPPGLWFPHDEGMPRLLALFLLLAATLAAAPLNNAVADFSTASNPNGNWSYGTRIPDFLDFAIKDPSDPSLDYWMGNGGLPRVSLNTTASSILADNILHPTDYLNLIPNANFHAVLRWTAPAAGDYTFSGAFRLHDNTSHGMAALISENDSTLLLEHIFSSYLEEQSFQFTRTLAAGGFVDFVATSHNGQPQVEDFYIWEALGVQLDVSSAAEVPEPASCTLIAAGLATLALRRRTRART